MCLRSGKVRCLKTVEFTIARPLLRRVCLNRQGVDAVIGDVFHQRRIDCLLFLDPTHSVEQLTHGNNLEVAAVAGDVGLLEGECVHQHCLNFLIFHGCNFI